MSEFEEARSFGLIDLPYGQSCFHVHLDRYRFIRVGTDGNPRKAMWQGNSILVEMSWGERRVYDSSLSPSGYFAISQ